MLTKEEDDCFLLGNPIRLEAQETTETLSCKAFNSLGPRKEGKLSHRQMRQ